MWAVYKFGRGLALHAHGLTRWVGGVGPHANERVSLHQIDRSTARAAEGTKALLFFDFHVVTFKVVVAHFRVFLE